MYVGTVPGLPALCVDCGQYRFVTRDHRLPTHYLSRKASGFDTGSEAEAEAPSA